MSRNFEITLLLRVKHSTTSVHAVAFIDALLIIYKSVVPSESS